MPARALIVAMLLSAACGGDDGAGGPDGGSSDGGPGPDASVVPVSQRVCSSERVLVSNQSVIFRKSLEYDAAGRLGAQTLELGWDYLDEELDVNGDSMTRRFYYSYDINGRQSTFEADNGADGTIDWVRYHYRNPESGLLEYWIDDRDITGGIAWTHRADYTYTDNVLTSYQVANYTTPATVYEQVTHEYTDSLLTKITRNNNPVTGGQECVDWVETRIYNDERRIERIELDGYPNASAPACPNDRLDDVPDLVIYYDYDDQDRLIQRRFDAGGDSSIERRETFTYDCE